MAEQQGGVTIADVKIKATADTSSAKRSLKTLADKVKELQNGSAGASKSTQQMADTIAKSSGKIEKMRAIVSGALSKSGGISKASKLGNTGKRLNNVSSSANKASSSVIRLGNVSKGATANIRKMLVALSTAPFRRLATSIGSAVKKLSNFFTAIKRIAIYRAIRFALKEISQAFREGIGNLYQYSLLINGTFAKSMDSLATSALYAKNSLAAMVAPLINAVAPAVDYVVDKFVDLLNTINELFATLTGAETWTRALKYPTQFAEAADDANGKAKKLRATLLGFDEINRLDDNNKGSRGSSADNLDYSKMFTEEVTTGKMKGIVDTIREAFASGNFEDIGREIGEKLKKGLDGIPWKKIQERIRKNASSVASLINGFISTEGLADSLGTTIGEAFNTVIEKVDTFFSEVKWNDLGTFVGTSINKGLKTINFFELGTTIKNIISGALDFAKSLLISIDWKDVGRKIGEFLNGIDFSEVLQKLGETLSELIEDAIDLAWELIKTSPVAGTLAVAFLGMKFGSILGTNMASGIASSGLTGKISGLIPTTATIVVTALVGYKIGNKIWDNLSDGMQDKLEATMQKFDKFLADAFGIETEAYKNMKHSWQAAKDLTEQYYSKIKEHEGQTNFLRSQGFSDETIRNAHRLKAEMDILQSSRDVAKALGLGTNELGKQIEARKTIAKYTDDEVKAWLKLQTETIKINLEAAFGSWTTLAENFKKKFADAKSKIKTTFTDIGKTIGGWINDALGLNISVTSTSKTTGSIGKEVSVKAKAYAGGGAPETGSLFLAGERGAELISSSGGTTSVANRDQIAESVAVGNEESNALLREQNDLLRRLLSKDNTTVITTGQITSALNRANARSGNTVVAVG